MSKLINKVFFNSQTKGSFILVITRLLNALFGFGFWIIVTRFTQLADVGLASSFISIIVLIGAISTLGSEHTYMQFAKKIKLDLRFYLFSFFINVFSTLLYILIFRPKSIYDMSYGLIFLLIFSAGFLLTVKLINDGYFIGKNNFRMLLIFTVLDNASRLLFIVIFRNRLDIFIVILAWLVSLFLAASISSLVIYLEKKSSEETLEESNVKTLVKTGITIHTEKLLYTLIPKILPTLLIIWASEEISGIFYIVWMLVNLFYSIANALSIAAVATIKKENKLEGLKHLIFYYIGLLVTAIIFGLFLGDFVLNLFDPQLVEPATPFLQFLSFTLIIFVFYQFRVTDLRLKESFISVITLNLIQSILFFSFLFIFKTKYGLVGVGVIFIGSIFVSTLISLLIQYLNKKINKNVISS